MVDESHHTINIQIDLVPEKSSSHSPEFASPYQLSNWAAAAGKSLAATDALD